MKTNRYLLPLFLLATLLALPSCKKSEIPEYNQQYNAVRFPYRTTDRGNEETPGYDFDRNLFLASYSFFGNESATSHTLSVPLYLIGYEANYDRTVQVELLPHETTAPSGSYRIVEGIIAAGDSVGHLKIELNNFPELQNGNVEVAYKIVASPHLQAGPPEQSKLLVTWGTRLLPPTLSDHRRTYNTLINGTQYIDDSMDYFSLRALEVIVKALGWNDWDDKEKHKDTYNPNGYKYLPASSVIDSRKEAYKRQIADYIEKYNQQNPTAPLLHDGGKLRGQPIEARK